MALEDVLRALAQEIPARSAELDTVSELDARREFVDPVLAELGWSGLKRLRREYSVRGQKRLKVDYALLGDDGKPVAFVEAKAPREDLTKHVGQVLRYADHDKVGICALTTGKLWWLYLPRARQEFDDGRFAILHMTAMRAGTVAKILEETLGYRALMTGAAESIAKQRLQGRKDYERRMTEIPRAWDRLLSEPSSHLVNLVSEEVFQATGQEPDGSEIRRALRSAFGRSKPRPSVDPPLEMNAVTLRAVVSAVEAELDVDFLKNRYGEQGRLEAARYLVMYFALRYTAASYSTVAQALGLARHPTMARERSNGEVWVEHGYTLVAEQIAAAEGADEASVQICQWHRAVFARLQLED